LTFAVLAAGEEHTCGLTTLGAAYCWGSNRVGQIGNGAFEDATTPVAVSGGLSFIAITAGASHTCGITASGAAYCWGHGLVGQLGNGSSSISPVPVPVSGGQSFTQLAAGLGSSSCGLTATGAAYCWGDGVLAPAAVPGGLTFSALTIGAGHICGLTTAGGAYCWGDNYWGQLGRGTFGYSTVPVIVAPFSNNAVPFPAAAPAGSVRRPAFPGPGCVASIARRATQLILDSHELNCGHRGTMR
jgi:alpha-tubulin suppressor-like RCC1 family protein